MSNNWIAIQQHKLEAPDTADGTIKRADTLETRLAVPHESPHDPATNHLRYPRELKTYVHKKTLYTNVHSCSIHNSQTMETIQM